MDPARLVDFLTDDESSLLSRPYFMLRFEEEFKKSWRYGWPYSLVLFTVDGFDRIEEAEGERAVRSATLDICGELLSASRDTDLSTRLERDRFALLLPGTNGNGARAFVERVIRSIAEGAFGRYQVHVGGSVAPKDDLGSADAFLARAEEAVAQARERADGSFVLAE